MTVDQQGPAENPTAAGAPERRRRTFGLALILVLLGALLAGVGGAFLATDFHVYTATGGTMAPTIAPGAKVVVQHVGASSLGRGDVVVVDSSAWGFRELTFRRIIGLGGDTVACCTAGRVTVDGKPLAEPYTGSANDGRPAYSVAVPAGRLFLLADARGSAVDSRLNLSSGQGTLPASAVKGRVVWRAGGGPVDGQAGPLRIDVGLLALGLLLLGLGLLALLARAAVLLSRSVRSSRGA